MVTAPTAAALPCAGWFYAQQSPSAWCPVSFCGQLRQIVRAPVLHRNHTLFGAVISLLLRSF